MKEKFLLMILVGIAFISCKDQNEDTNTPEETPIEEKLKQNSIILGEAFRIYGTALELGDTLEAFNAMGDYLAQEENVQDAHYKDLESISITFKNGLRSSIRIIPVDAEGIHLRRGGGGPGSLHKFELSKASTSGTIKNNKILFFLPYTYAFKYTEAHLQSLVDICKSTSREMEVVLLKDGQVSLASLDDFGEYGLIILDTHGETDGFLISYLDETVNYGPRFDWEMKSASEKLIAQLKHIEGVSTDLFANGQLELNIDIHISPDQKSIEMNFGVKVTEEYIRNLKIDLSDAVLFGNHCYSGHVKDGSTENNLPEAWKSLGLATYYGYGFKDGSSSTVDNQFAKAMEIKLISNLIQDLDSTGNAHLDEDGQEEFFKPGLVYFEPPRSTKQRKKLGASILEEDPDVQNVDQSIQLYFRQFHQTGYSYNGCLDSIRDPRDTQFYRTICIGPYEWFAENLNYATSESVCYDNNPDNCKKFGRLYTFNDAMDACPDGWRLPSDKEFNYWYEFANTSLSRELGPKMQSRSGWPTVGYEPGTDEFGFSALPAGFFNSDEGLFKRLNEGTGWWLLGLRNPGPHEARYVRQLYPVEGTTGGGPIQNFHNPNYKFSCRCIRLKK